MKLDDMDDFMDEAAKHGVSFKVETNDNGLRFAVGWPLTMASEVRDQLQAWVNAHDAELALTLGEMVVEVSGGKPGITIISVDIDSGKVETKH